MARACVERKKDRISGKLGGARLLKCRIMCAKSSLTEKSIACNDLHLPSRWYAAQPATEGAVIFVCALGDNIFRGRGSAGWSDSHTLGQETSIALTVACVTREPRPTKEPYAAYRSSVFRPDAAFC